MTLNGHIVPGGWHFAKLGEVADILNGDRGSNYPSKGSFTVSGIRFINAGHLRDGQVSSVDMNFISPNHYDRLGGGKVHLNDVLYCLRGSLGKAAIVKDDSLGAIASSLAIIRPKYSESARYIYYFLVSPLGAKQISEFDNGSAQPNLAAASLKQYGLPLAPLAEQTRIADKLDTVLARVDACRDRLARVAPLLKRFRQSVLAAATSGRLTEDWRARIAEHVDGEIPHGWRLAKFSDVCTEITVGFVGKMADQYVDAGVPFLRSMNVRAMRFDPKGLLYVSKEFHSRIAKSTLRPGDLAIVRSGAPGVCCVIPQVLPEANCSDLVIARPGVELVSEYACIFMNSTFAVDFVKANQVGVAQAHFNVGSMKVTPLPLPPVGEQKEIVRRVESLFAFADRLETRLAQARSAAERLTPALLAKAFRGELVPQDPDDEPAAELLKRLAAQQAPIKGERRKPAVR